MTNNETKSKQKSKKKRTLQDADIEDNEQIKSNSLKNVDHKQCLEKKAKIQYELEKEAEKLIKADDANKKYWDDCKELLGKGKKVCIHYLNIKLNY